MRLIYKIEPKKLLQIRNEVFVNNGIPALKSTGFEKAPFPESLFGRNNLGDYTYELCRVNKDSELQMITTHISRGDRWIKIYLNIFRLKPALTSLEQLKNIDGMQFRLPPNSITSMRLRIDGFKGMPLFRMIEHKIKRFITNRGFQRRVKQLGILIERDLDNIDAFVKRWHEFHQMMTTDWSGKKVE